MNVAVAALHEHLSEVKEALDKKEQVILLHEGKEFASLRCSLYLMLKRKSSGSKNFPPSACGRIVKT